MKDQVIYNSKCGKGNDWIFCKFGVMKYIAPGEPRRGCSINKDVMNEDCEFFQDKYPKPT
uniref:Uncharacterized protein n=1 Tax=viral metagenome TaxID=1070528 RepID=A0A6M3LR14_9ZZZZ